VHSQSRYWLGTIHTWTTSDGTVKTILSNFEIDWSNLTPGRSRGSLLSEGRRSSSPDGTPIINSNNARFIAQGEGLVYADLGRTSRPSREVVLLGRTTLETLFPNVCEALG
jgi:hypothetical protein